tara:strand:+ start:236 stop:472 length:237 start_codon:yes stop_codon:yes gene_type:complete
MVFFLFAVGLILNPLQKAPVSARPGQAERDLREAVISVVQTGGNVRADGVDHGVNGTMIGCRSPAVILGKTEVGFSED